MATLIACDRCAKTHSLDPVRPVMGPQTIRRVVLVVQLGDEQKVNVDTHQRDLCKQCYAKVLHTLLHVEPQEAPLC